MEQVKITHLKNCTFWLQMRRQHLHQFLDTRTNQYIHIHRVSSTVLQKKYRGMRKLKSEIIWNTVSEQIKSFIVHSGHQRPNPRHLCEPLGELKAWSKQWVLKRQRKVYGEEQARMPAWSEFHSEAAAMLKPREAKVLSTWRMDNRLVLEEHREHAGMWQLRRERR